MTRLPQNWIAALDAREIQAACGTTCPACGRERRGAHDRRPAVDWKTPRNWACAGCKVGGGPVRWLAWNVLRRVPASGADWRALGEAALAMGWIDGDITYQRRDFVPAPEPPPAWPPRDEVLDVWHRARPIDREVGAWMASRGIDAERIRAWDAARVLPAGPLPSWAKAWPAGWRCLLPCVDESGEIVTLRARWVRDEPPRNGAKTRPPTDFECRGSVLAGPGALDSTGPVLVVEGEPAFLFALSRATVPVVGVYAGVGSPRIWRTMRGRVLVSTDADDAGDRYAEQVTAWRAERLRPVGGVGFDDAVLAGWKPADVL